MSEQTETTMSEVARMQPWQGGVVAGIAGGFGMGLFMTLQMTNVIEVAIPALWMLEGGAAGWVIHMANSAIFGVVFAAIVMEMPDGMFTITRSVLVGAVFGAALWVVAAGFVMPVWLDLAGFATPPAIPNLNLTSLGAHLIYGLILGATYPLVVRSEPQF